MLLLIIWIQKDNLYRIVISDKLVIKLNKDFMWKI